MPKTRKTTMAFEASKPKEGKRKPKEGKRAARAETRFMAKIWEAKG
jgi:hypothetical protein